MNYQDTNVLFSFGEDGLRGTELPKRLTERRKQARGPAAESRSHEISGDLGDWQGRPGMRNTWVPLAAGVCCSAQSAYHEIPNACGLLKPRPQSESEWSVTRPQTSAQVRGNAL